jgi:hypothetical protein
LDRPRRLVANDATAERFRAATNTDLAEFSSGRRPMRFFHEVRFVWALAAEADPSVRWQDLAEFITKEKFAEICTKLELQNIRLQAGDHGFLN